MQVGVYPRNVPAFLSVMALAKRMSGVIRQRFVSPMLADKSSLAQCERALPFGKPGRCRSVVNLGEQLLSEPHAVGANEQAEDYTRTAAAPGELGQIVGYRTKKDRPTGYADLFHASIITPIRV